MSDYFIVYWCSSQTLLNRISFSDFGNRIIYWLSIFSHFSAWGNSSLSRASSAVQFVQSTEVFKSVRWRSWYTTGIWCSCISESITVFKAEFWKLNVKLSVKLWEKIRWEKRNIADRRNPAEWKKLVERIPLIIKFIWFVCQWWKRVQNVA